MHGVTSIEYVIDGSRIKSLEEFYDEISRSVIPGYSWGRNLDALNDILRGGFGTPDEGFILRWSGSEFSRNKLGYEETVRQLKIRLGRCHPTNQDVIKRDIANARNGVGPTVYDWLIEIIQDHGEGGDQADNNVALILD